jgi:glycosyltransferase involved in cell wall biosynthesis
MNKEDEDTPRRPVVIMVVPRLGRGGAERVVVNLANHWDHVETDLIIFVGSLDGEYMSSLTTNAKVVSLGAHPRFSNTLRVGLRLRTELRNLHVVACVSHMTDSSRFMLRLRALRLICFPIIAVEHNESTKHDQSSVFRRLRAGTRLLETRLLFKLANRVICVSERVKADVISIFKVPPQRTTVINNPIDYDSIDFDGCLSDQTNPNEQGVKILAIGRLQHQKGFDILLRAYALAGVSTSHHLQIVGVGPLREYLESIAKSTGTIEQVHFLGFQEKPWHLMKQADAVCIPSRWEGDPLVLFEALACAVPVICFEHLLQGYPQLRGNPLIKEVEDFNEVALATMISSIGRRVTTLPAYVDSRREPDHVVRKYLDILQVDSGG